MDAGHETVVADSKAKPLYTQLYFQVLAAIFLGVSLGHLYPAAGEAMKPFGDGFIKLIKMLIAPIIFVTVVHGIASMGDLKKVGRVGVKALIYFEVVTTLALVIGLIVVNVLQPGAGMNVDVEFARYEGGRELHREVQGTVGGWLHPRHYSEHVLQRLRRGQHPAGLADRAALCLRAAVAG